MTKSVPAGIRGNNDSKSAMEANLSFSKKPSAESEVNSPGHYTGEHECVDVMEQQFPDEWIRASAVTQAFQYLFRCHKKDNLDSNLEKALWWLLKACGHDPRAVFRYLKNS